ncbi:hypothetical protein Q4Q34_10125 [Flavivirga abyssicola]|uniref:hypothetical protein n=1 Tax=Flavivirga abyssicola TaxID=3063533 RepID=UPI0026DF22E1|nr:hypothetical protein [Flavivirga sp. MEBiC07777]WVK11582.1 hypothetical protein Q4Q34_10125 [Flavivirga sp. MEBiC07777]
MKILRIFFVIIFGSLSSCNPSTETLLDGNWAIDTFIFNEEDIFDKVVVVNMMSLSSETGKIILPKIDKKLKTNKERIGRWEYFEDTFQISINSNSDYLNGYFDICFKKDVENNYIKLVLKSDNLYLEAAKVLSEIPQTTILPVTCGDVEYAEAPAVP